MAIDEPQRVDDPRELGLDPKTLARADDLLSEWTERGTPILPAAALLVGRSGRWLAPRYFGRQDAEGNDSALLPGAIFPVASITKPVVAIALMQLLERGTLGLTDVASRHWPRFASNGKQGVRLIHLLTHTSGLPENLPGNPRLRRNLSPLQAYVEDLLVADLAFPPGAELVYSNPGYLALGEILRAVVGKPTAEILRERVFDPLGMRDTGLGAAGLDDGRLVRVATAGFGYDGATDWNSDYWRTLSAPWGGLYSTVEDLGRLAAAVVRGRRNPGFLLRPSTWRLMTENHLKSSRLADLSERSRRREGWGLGWKMNAPAGTGGVMVDMLDDKVFGHQGVTGAVVWMDPQTDLYCVLLTSAGGVRAPWRMTAVSNIVAAALNAPGVAGAAAYPDP